jgi:hypothetical protein
MGNLAANLTAIRLEKSRCQATKKTQETKAAQLPQIQLK